MSTVAKLLVRKRALLERLESDPGPNEREEIDRLLAQIATALSLLELETPPRRARNRLQCRSAPSSRIASGAYRALKLSRCCGSSANPRGPGFVLSNVPTGRWRSRRRICCGKLRGAAGSA